MTNLAVHIEDLGKQYRIGRRERYRTLRESIVGAVRLGGRRRESAPVIWALRDVEFDVRHGDVVGVIGRNGAGKSTLLKILARVTEPTHGAVDLYGRVGSLLEVGTGFHPELTGRENIFLNGAILGMRRSELRSKLDEIVDFAEIEQFIDTPVKLYSSGMYMRLAFAVAAHLEPEIMVIDEVLAVGDAAFQRKCLGKMSEAAGQGRTVLFVSHNMGAISNLCTRGVVLDHGSVLYTGDVGAAIDTYHRHVLGSSTHLRDQPPHVLYADAGTGEEAFRITRVELLDHDRIPKALVGTWDDVTIRVSFRAQQRVQNGSVAVELRALDGSRLMLLSTRPDSSHDLAIEVGEHAVDCRIRRLPLTGGEYVLGAGLAIPNTEWLWLDPDLARLTVVPRDVFGSGLAPTSSRALVAVDHDWQVAA
jgi:lipopolysaccharide transport system ATP-binding protein